MWHGIRGAAQAGRPAGAAFQRDLKSPRVPPARLPRPASSPQLNALERRLFFIPSFKIYGSVAGFFDYGPPGCAIKQNVTQTWRNHFVLEENMLEVECPAVTPEVVLKASGHVDRFTDFMVTDTVTGEPHRADHLLEGHLEALLENGTPAATKGGAATPLTAEQAREALDVLARVGELGAAELGAALAAYGVKSPDTKNAISPPFPFNLMFKSVAGGAAGGWGGGWGLGRAAWGYLPAYQRRALPRLPPSLHCSDL